MKVLQIKTKSISSSIGKEAVKKFLINSLTYTEQKAIKIINDCPVVINININYLTDRDKKEFLLRCIENMMQLGINPDLIYITDINVYELPYRHQYIPEVNMNDIAHINSIYIVPEQVMENIFTLLNKNVKDRKDMHKIADMIGDIESTINKLVSVKNILKTIK